MDAIIQTLLACVGSSGLTAIILALLQRRWSKADKRDAVSYTHLTLPTIA